MSETVLPKTQTTSPTTPHYRRFSPRWSALWAPHHPEPRPRHLEPQPYRRQTGGIAALEARHAVARLLMVQNPHRQSSAALLKGQRARASPGATCFPMTPLANGRNCTVRGARSSSPHVEDATKRGELHHERRDTPATRRGKASNGAKPPSPKMRRTPKGPESAGEPGRDLLSDDTASKREKLHRERRAVELTPRRGRHQTGGIAP